jgi:hypothetical protein
VLYERMEEQRGREEIRVPVVQTDGLSEGAPVARRAKTGFLAAAVTLFIVLVVPILWIGRFFDAMQALGEYLRPTTIEGTYLPQGCTQTSETPPSDLMRIVENQESLYHLALQKVVVCRTTYRLLGFEQRFPGGLNLGEEDPCRPLHRGCCSCQFRRHVIVDVADPSGSGSVLVQAALIQSRWDYLRLNWNNVRPWAWRWCLIVALLLVCARLFFLSGRGLIMATRHVLRGHR